MFNLFFFGSIAIALAIILFDHFYKPKFNFGPIQKEWLKTLRKHPERQLKKNLGIMTENNIQMCCLGQLGVLKGCLSWLEGHSGTLKVLYDVGEDGNTESKSYPSYSYKTLGLNNHVGSPSVKKLEDGTELTALASMNDGAYTWPQIADHVEKYGHYYFTKSY